MQRVSSGSSRTALLALDAADERLGVRHGRRPAERRRGGLLDRHRREHAHAQGARHQPERGRGGSGRSGPRRTAHTGSRGGSGQPREVERQRGTDERDPPRERTLERDGQGPPAAPNELEQRVGRGGARRLRARRREQRAGPPCSTVSRGADGDDRVGLRQGASDPERDVPAEPRSTRSGASVSWTTTSPRNRSANSGVTRLSTVRLPGRRASPAATRIVCRSLETPTRRARRRGGERSLPRVARRAGSGRAGGSTRMVARPPRGTIVSSESPASGKRSASRTAAPTSAIASWGGGGGAIATASVAGVGTTSREP